MSQRTNENQKLVAALRPPRGEVLGGGSLQLPSEAYAAALVQQEKLDTAERMPAHVARWERFRDRTLARAIAYEKLFDRHPRLRPMTEDIRWWEASKAGIKAGDVDMLAWFWETPQSGRIDLIRIERLRRIDERKFKLARLKLSQMSGPNFYFDGRRN